MGDTIEGGRTRSGQSGRASNTKGDDSKSGDRAYPKGVELERANGRESNHCQLVDSGPRNGHLRPASPDPRDRLPFLKLCLLGFAAKRALDRWLRRHGVNALQYSILARLHQRGPTHLRLLARHLGVTRQAVMVATRKLRGRNLVAVVPAWSHARLVTLALTDDGRTLKANLEPTVARLARHTIGRLTDRCLDEFAEALVRVEISLPRSLREMYWTD